MSTAYSAASVYIPKNAGVKAGTLQAWRPDVNLLQDIDVVQNTANGSRVNEQGLIEFVPANTARWDWSEGLSCPSLLVEKQRTNLFTYSEEFDNAAWFKISATITPNTAIAPDGNTTADSFNINNSSGLDRASQEKSLTIGDIVTHSCFVKANTFNGAIIIRETNNRANTSFNLATQNFTTSGANLIGGGFDDYGNGWFRVYVVFEAPSTGNFNFDIATFNTGTTDNFFVWGAQFEEASYPTSYIKTGASIATRNRDKISKSGIASLINSGEGTLYAELSVFSTDDSRILLRDASVGTNTIRLSLNGNNISVSKNGVVLASSPSAYTINTFVKIAIRYSALGTAISTNGNAVNETSGDASHAPNILDMFQLGGNFSLRPLNGRIRALAWWKTDFNNAELQNISTP